MGIVSIGIDGDKAGIGDLNVPLGYALLSTFTEKPVVVFMSAIGLSVTSWLTKEGAHTP